MIIPVRCFTCNKVLGDLYKSYLIQMKELNLDESNDIITLSQELFIKNYKEKFEKSLIQTKRQVRNFKN